MALENLSKAASSNENIMLSSIEAAKVGVTTGEWAEALRSTFGEFKAPTGISNGIQSNGSDEYSDVRKRVEKVRGRVEKVRLKRVLDKNKGIELNDS